MNASNVNLYTPLRVWRAHSHPHLPTQVPPLLSTTTTLHPLMMSQPGAAADVLTSLGQQWRPKSLDVFISPPLLNIVRKLLIIHVHCHKPGSHLQRPVCPQGGWAGWRIVNIFGSCGLQRSAQSLLLKTWGEHVKLLLFLKQKIPPSTFLSVVFPHKNTIKCKNPLLKSRVNCTLHSQNTATPEGHTSNGNVQYRALQKC